MATQPQSVPLQAVVFCLGAERFGLPVAIVREILDWRAVSHLPSAPDWLLGLADVRGLSVPVIDLRTRLGLPMVETTLATRILILDVPINGRTLTLGVVIDRVLSVSTFDPAELDPAPDIGVRWRSDYITGVARSDDGFVVMIDAARIFSSDDATVLFHADQAACPLELQRGTAA